MDLYIAFHDSHALGMPAWLRSPDVYDRDAVRDGVRRLLADADASLFVAEDRGRVVGLAEVHLRRDEETPVRVGRTYGHLQSLMVAATHRRRGLGAALLAAAERWAEERGAAEVQLDTWEFPAGPLRFYGRRGYRTVKRKLVRVLPAAGRDRQDSGRG